MTADANAAADANANANPPAVFAPIFWDKSLPMPHGAIAKQFLSNIKFTAFVSAVGPLKMETPYQELNFATI